MCGKCVVLFSLQDNIKIYVNAHFAVFWLV